MLAPNKQRGHTLPVPALLKRILTRMMGIGESQVPRTRRSGDVFLVEFPKSGVTWFSQVLANAFLIDAGRKDRATFTSVRNYIPDLNVSTEIEAPRLGSAGVRFYKSHATFRRAYVHTIYIARHPSAVMKSYMAYSRATGTSIQDFSSFCDDPDRGIEAWRAHVRSWLANGKNSSRYFVHLVRYEEMVDDLPKVMGELSDNFGWNLSPEAIAQAVAFCERSQMAAQEDLYRRHNPNHRMKFVGTGSDKIAVPDDLETEARIRSTCAAELHLLGYTDDSI